LLPCCLARAVIALASWHAAAVILLSVLHSIAHADATCGKEEKKKKIGYR
jgi:hypothetical protein